MQRSRSLYTREQPATDRARARYRKRSARVRALADAPPLRQALPGHRPGGFVRHRHCMTKDVRSSEHHGVPQPQKGHHGDAGGRTSRRAYVSLSHPRRPATPPCFSSSRPQPGIRSGPLVHTTVRTRQRRRRAKRSAPQTSHPPLGRIVSDPPRHGVVARGIGSYLVAAARWPATAAGYGTNRSGQPVALPPGQAVPWSVRTGPRAFPGRPAEVPSTGASPRGWRYLRAALGR